MKYSMTRQSPVTGKLNTMEIEMTEEQYQELQLPTQRRRNMQDILPHASADEREFLISGCLPEEFESLCEKFFKDGHDD